MIEVEGKIFPIRKNYRAAQYILIFRYVPILHTESLYCLLCFLILKELFLWMRHTSNFHQIVHRLSKALDETLCKIL